MLASASAYPRDLRGHGADPPHARWPGGARIAVQFVLNYEEGGENSVLHGDAVVPFHGRHQAALAVTPQAHATLVALDLLDATDADGLRRMLRILSDDAARLTSGEAALAESSVTVRCLTLPDGSVPQRDDDPKVVAVVGRAY